MKADSALRKMIKLYSPYDSFTSDTNLAQYLTETPLDKFGCLLELNNVISNFDMEHALSVGASLWRLASNEREFVEKYHKQLGELLNAAQCLDDWQDSNLVCDRYKDNLTFNLALAVHLPSYDDGDFFAELMDCEPEYGPHLIFKNAVEKRWYLVLIMLIVKANHFYFMTDFNDIPSDYVLPRDVADEVLSVAMAVGPEIGKVVGMFIDRTIGTSTPLYKLDQRCTSITLRARNNRAESSLQTDFPNFRLIAEASNNLVARLKHYQQPFRHRVFDVLLGAVTATDATGEGTAYKEVVAMDIGQEFAINHTGHDKWAKLFSGRQRSTAAERTVVLSYLISNYGDEHTMEWFKGCARCGTELIIFSECDLQQLYALLSATDVQITEVVYVCPNSDSCFVINEASETKGVNRYCVPIKDNERDLLVIALDAHLTSTDFETLKMWRVREINDSWTLGMTVFGDKTLAQLLGYQEMCPYLLSKFKSVHSH